MSKGYWIAMVDVTDQERFALYAAALGPIFERHRARFLARGGRGRGRVFEGTDASRLVIVEFESYQAALDCYHSPDYRAALKLREAGSTAHFAVVEGVAE